MNLLHKMADKKITISERAAFWVCEEARGLTTRGRAARDRWLAQNEEHRQAWMAAREAIERVERYAAQPEILSLRHAALEIKPRPYYSRLRAAVLVGALILGTGVVTTMPDLRQGIMQGLGLESASGASSIYATRVGEQSTVTLPDGSIMALNTDSRAEVIYSKSERRIRLLKGQALFTVAHGQNAPFIVQAANRSVTATGTQFEVHIEAESLSVALVEGKVDVERISKMSELWTLLSATKETLTPGQVLRVEGDTVRIAYEDVSRLTSWRDGVAVFSETPLTEAVAEMNRYAVTPIVLSGLTSAQYRVSGTFRIGNAQRFAKTMAEVFDLHVTTSDDGRITLSSKPM